jgi:hypothetical protein
MSYLIYEGTYLWAQYQNGDGGGGGVKGPISGKIVWQMKQKKLVN